VIDSDNKQSKCKPESRFFTLSWMFLQCIILANCNASMKLGITGIYLQQKTQNDLARADAHKQIFNNGLDAIFSSVADTFLSGVDAGNLHG